MLYAVVLAIARHLHHRLTNSETRKLFPGFLVGMG